MRICRKVDEESYEEFGVALSKTNLTKIEKLNEHQLNASKDYVLELRGRKYFKND